MQIDISDLNNPKYKKVKINNDLFININNKSFILIKDFYLIKKNIGLVENHLKLVKLNEEK